MNRVEEDLTSFFEHSLDLMCIAGFDGYFKRLNPAWEKTLGHSAEDLMSQPYRNFIHPDDYARTLSEAQRISEGANTISFENRYRCKDGRYRWLQWRAHPDTQRGLVFAAARDMTKYKELEQELRSKSALQRAMLDGANYAIISCDSEGTIQDFNAGAQRLLGYTPEEVTNKVSPCIFHDPQEVRRRAEELTIELGRPVRPDFEAFVAKAMLGPPDENEWTYIRKDGTRVPVMLSVTIMRDDQGRALGFLGVASDLTARHKADHARRDLEARLKAILDNTTAIVFLKDREGAYQLVNKRYEELFHLSQEQMTGKSDYDIFPPEYARAFRENDARVLASGQPMILEETAPLDGETRTYVSVKFPVQD
ncbi:MAG: PAS domain S-box protein, partial [Verrucomicrobium sp.]